MKQATLSGQNIRDVTNSWRGDGIGGGGQSHIKKRGDGIGGAIPYKKDGDAHQKF